MYVWTELKTDTAETYIHTYKIKIMLAVVKLMLDIKQ